MHDLDHASTSPLRPAARDALVAALDHDWGDPSRVHQRGMEARAALEDARDRIAAALGVRRREVVLTSGASESIATVCRGVEGHQVVTAVEHSAVRLGAAAAGPCTVVGVDGTGRVDPDAIVAALTPDTSVVHVQWGNHEVGTTQPLGPIIDACRARGVLVHVDAAQAVGHVPVDLAELGADLVSISGHKFGAPLGTGVLHVRRGVRLRPLLVGGDQELGRRAGTESTPAVLGLAVALEEAAPVAAAEEVRLRALTDRLRAAVAGLDGVTPYGHPDERLPHIVAVGIADVEPQAVLFGLDRRRVAAHSGSACASADLEPSPVLEAMGVDAHHSLRLSVGWSTTEADVDACVAALPEVLDELRSLRR